MTDSTPAQPKKAARPRDSTLPGAESKRFSVRAVALVACVFSHVVRTKMSKEQTIHLGYEVGTGVAIAVPLRHMAVTGQTQQSGKTTTLEALIGRADTTALAFVTKRGEGSFAAGRRVAPYFRDRADWK